MLLGIFCELGGLHLARSASLKGGGGCAAHIPLRCRGIKKVQVNADIGFLEQLMHAGGDLQQVIENERLAHTGAQFPKKVSVSPAREQYRNKYTQ